MTGARGVIGQRARTEPPAGYRQLRGGAFGERSGELVARGDVEPRPAQDSPLASLDVPVDPMVPAPTGRVLIVEAASRTGTAARRDTRNE